MSKRRARDRAERLVRIRRAQATVAASAAAGAARARARIAALSEEERDILAALSGDTPLHGFATRAMALALGRNARAMQKADAALQAAEARERHEVLLAKLLDTRAEAAAAQARQERERDALERRIAERFGRSPA